MSSHFSSEFDALLLRLEDGLLRMGGLAKESLARAAGGLFDRDLDSCNAVIAADEEIDEMETEVGRLAMEIVSRFTPVASDLRVVLSALRIGTSLERVGDECVSIARRARQMVMRSEQRETKLLEPLFDSARVLFSDALAALATRQAAGAAAIAPRDIDLDALCLDITEKLTQAVQRPEGLPGPDFANLAIIARSLERVGDQAKNIAAETLFRLNPRSEHHTF